MRARRMLATTTLVALLLSGCVPDPAPTTAEPKPSAAPLFASEEEALAAAVDAYEAYLAVSDQIAADGGANPERLSSVADATFVVQESVGFSEFAAAGLRAVGQTVIRNAQLQSFDPFVQEGEEAVRVYLCSDVSGVDVLDGTGASVVSSDRPNLTPFEVSFVNRSDQLLVATKDVWESGDICA